MIDSTTQFNGALAHLQRIDIIERSLILDMKNMDLQQWLYDLHNFYMQIMTVMDKDKEEELYKEYETLATKINQSLQSQYNPRNRQKQNISPNLIKELDQFHRKLLRIYKESGLQMQLQTSAERALK